jgi:hemoglobin-like flavoprotein
MSMSSHATELTRASFTRCLERRGFFAAFYRNFFAALPEAEPLFARTDLARQHKLIEHAIKILLIFPQQAGGEPTLLTRLAEKHSKAGLGIAPSWYTPFLDSLVFTASQFDPEFTQEIGAAWRESLEPGMDYMRDWDRRPG